MRFDTWSILILLNLCVAVGLTALTFTVWRRPTVNRRVAVAFLVFQLNLVLWTTARFLSHNAADLETSYYWAKLGLLASSLFSPIWLSLALAWGGHTRWLSPRRLILMALPEIVLGLVALTNDWHWLFVSAVQYHNGPGSFVISEGPLFYIDGVVSYIYISLALLLFLKLAKRTNGWLRQHCILVLAIALPPVFTDILRYTGFGEVTTDVTLLLVSTGGTIYAFFVFRHWLIDIVKTALTQAAEQMGDAILVLDPEARIIDVNRAASEMLNVKRTRFLGAAIQHVVENLRDLVANVDEVKTLIGTWTREPLQQITSEVEMLGTPHRTLSLMGWPTRDEVGGLLGHVITLRDITAKRMTERALEESESRYRDLFENALDIIYTHDMEGYFTSINKSGELTTGYTLDNEVKLNMAQITEPDQLARAKQMMLQKLADPSATAYELEIVARDGRRVTLEVNSRFMYREGMPVGVQGIARDVSAARANTKQMAHMVTQLETALQTALQLNSSHDSASLLRQTLSGISTLIAPHEAQILILDETGSTFSFRAIMNFAGKTEVTPVHIPLCPFTRTILEAKQARFVEDAVDTDALGSSLFSEGVRAYAGLPLQAPDRVIGILCVTYDHPYVFSPDSRQLIQILASHAAVAIANSRMLGNLKQAATTDPLTGLPNHRHLMDRLDEEMARARRGGHPLTVIMLDIDGFKLINDTHGHTVGDELLRRVARTVRAALRNTDILGRYGGDEFLALLPETGREGVQTVVKRVLSAVESQCFHVPSRLRSHSALASKEDNGSDSKAPQDICLPLRVSLGIAVFPIDSATRLELISLADAAMYASKRAGGNTVTMAHDTDSGFMAAQNHTFGVMEALVNAVDGKDHYTRAHSEDVAKFALQLSDSLGMQSDLKRSIRIAALLHDVGKIGIPDHILRKPGPLDDEEREIVRQHPLLSEMIMRETPQLTDMLDAVRHHHERWDGQGYPRGLRGEEIPIIARLLAVADAYSAMVTDRPYRKAMPLHEAIQELRRGAGTQFDPSLVEPFIEVVSSTSQFEAPARAEATA